MLYGVTTTDLGQRAKVFAALSDPTRLRLVELLAERGEMTGSALAEMLGISLALHCHHTKILTEAGVVHKRKEGQTTYCSLNPEVVSNALRGFLTTAVP